MTSVKYCVKKSMNLVYLIGEQVLLRYKSYIVRVASTFLYLVPLTLGLMEQKQIIPVELYESYYDSYVSTDTQLCRVTFYGDTIVIFLHLQTFFETNF